MPFSGFSEHTLGFLAELSRHDDPAWLAEHAAEHESVIARPAKEFVQALGPRLRELDPRIQAVPRLLGSIKSLERRRRYPRNPPPPRYKDSLDFWFWSGKRRSWDNSGFFVRLTPAGLSLAAGMIEFQKDTLARYRARVLDEARGRELAGIIATLREGGYAVGAETYKRTPSGMPRDHEHAALLRHGGVFATLQGEHPKELARPELVDFCVAHFERMAPLHAWLLGLFAVDR